MAFTEQQAMARIKVLGRERVEVVNEVAGEGDPDLIAGSLILAIGLRESSIRNITGDGGHGRGWLQIDDRFHQPWLRAHAACHDGAWTFSFSVRSGGALPAGRVPGMVAAEQYAIALLNANARFGQQNGVKAAHLKQFMVAAYNCGAGNAIDAYRSYGVKGVDHYTAGGDYGADVLANQRTVRAVLSDLHWT